MRLPVTALAAAAAALFATSKLAAAEGALLLHRGRAAAPPSGLAALNSGAERGFRAQRSAIGERLALQGGRLRLDPADGAAVERFVRGNAELLRVPPEWSLARELHGSAGAERSVLTFAREGVVIDGARGYLRFDDGAVTEAVFDLPGAQEVLGSFRVDAGAAESAALAHALAVRAARGRPGPAVFAAPATERRYLATPAGLVPAYAVLQQGTGIGEAYAIYVDARTGDVLKLLDLIDSGTGHYPLDPGFVDFTTGPGTGYVFKSVKAARKGQAKQVTLEELALGVPAPIGLAQGFVIGAFADTWDDNGNDAVATDLAFTAKPFNGTFDQFDQVNTYYWIHRFHTHLTTTLGTELALDHALPVINNVASGNPNAFFSPTAFPYGGHTTGYLAFFDQTAFVGPEGDLSRDPTVVCHEFVHAWLWFENLNFDGALDDPARAANEAVADYFSISFHGDTVIGRYADDVFPEFGIARNLQDADHFPETTQHAMTLTMSGLPEEHRNGEILGSFLMDLAEEFGAAAADALLFGALPAMPRDVGDIGYGAITTVNAVEATEMFLHACMAALGSHASVDVTEGLAILGAATARGIIGQEGSYDHVLLDFGGAFVPALVQIPSAFVQSGDQHQYYLQAPAGSRLRVRVQGTKNVKPDFSLVDLTGAVTPAVTAHAGKTTKKSGRIVEQKDIEPLLGIGGTYLLTVFAKNAKRGDYTLELEYTAP